jgi:hypothetical protein
LLLKLQARGATLMGTESLLSVDVLAFDATTLNHSQIER